MNNPSKSITMRREVALILAFALLAAILLCLPAYKFGVSVFTKKSGNTFKDDERYQAAYSEVETVAEEYRANGFDVSINETFTERTNSKGETTSLCTFTVSQETAKTGWSFLRAGLNSSAALAALAGCIVLCAIFALAGGTSPIAGRKLEVFGNLAVFFALIAFLFVPVFAMMNTYTFSRRLMLYCSGLITDGKEEFFDRLNTFLLEGKGGADTEEILAGLTMKNTGFAWLVLPCTFAMLLSALKLRFGEIKRAFGRGMLYTAVIIVCVVTLYPYYVMLITGFRSLTETNDMYFLHIFPTKWVWSNFSDIIDRGVLTYLKNSLLISGGATAIAMVCGIPAAYSMARRNFKGKKLFLGFVIMSQMFSPVVLMIGIYQLMSVMKLNDSVIGLMLINAAFNQAFAIWLLRGTFVSISPEMEQAAMIDGCSTMQSLFKILLPMAAPGIVTTLIFVFINAWNEYTISTVLITTAANKPITVGITTFSSFNMIEWQYLFAASLLATIPVVILFICIEKHLVSGLTSGGVKG